MVKIQLISANGMSVGTFRSPVIPRRDEKIVREGTECTVTKVAYDFDAEDIYALVFVDAVAVSQDAVQGKDRNANEEIAEATVADESVAEDATAAPKKRK